MRQPILVCLTLLLLTVVIYAPTRKFDFVNYDDPEYVSANPHVQAGLTADGFHWAFTTTFYSNWAPLTWLTLMAQARLFGLHPAGYHLTNVALHAANAILLFAILSSMTGCRIRSAIVAALFAVHPMHVESVAWIAEWKDVLSTFFLFLAIGSYDRFIKTRGAQWYAALLVCFALSLLAKSMGVTLPALLLLLDYWPLKRTDWRRAVMEKVPLLLMSIATASAAFFAQSAGLAVAAAQQLSIPTRCANAVLSYITYIYKLLIPTDLAVFYPYPLQISSGAVCTATAALCIASIAALLQQRRYITAGWFWFLGTLVPVIGIVQVGSQSMADRYSYVPSIGLFILAVWWAADVLEKSRLGRQLAVVLATVVICLFTALACLQVQFWRNTESLFIHTAAVAPNNWVADMELGDVAFDRGDLSTAAGDFSQMIRLRPLDGRGYYNLANCLTPYNLPKAISFYEKAVELNPSSTLFQKNLDAARQALQQRNSAEKMQTQ